MTTVQPRSVTSTNIDFIGDIHGCFDSLKQLLERLGYEKKNGIYQHSERHAIFVGDLIDRGPNIRETLELVCNMCRVGSARMVLGNHEYNAVRFQRETVEYLRTGDESLLPQRLLKLMKETLEQFQEFPQQWQSFCQWFSSLPLFIEEDGYRVVHACWDQELIDLYQKHYVKEGINEDFIESSKVEGSFESQVVDRLTRGTSMPLPDGMQLESRDGFIRRFFRTKFWAHSPETYGDVVFQPDPLPYDVAEHPIRCDHKERLVNYPEDQPPVFFGHYWLKGRPQPLKNNVACLDYSAVNFGRLTAYSYSGEPSLLPDNYTWVYVEKHE